MEVLNPSFSKNEAAGKFIKGVVPVVPGKTHSHEKEHDKVTDASELPIKLLHIHKPADDPVRNPDDLYENNLESTPESSTDNSGGIDPRGDGENNNLI